MLKWEEIIKKYSDSYFEDSKSKVSKITEITEDIELLIKGTKFNMDFAIFMFLKYLLNKTMENKITKKDLESDIKNLKKVSPMALSIIGINKKKALKELNMIRDMGAFPFVINKSPFSTFIKSGGSLKGGRPVKFDKNELVSYLDKFLEEIPAYKNRKERSKMSIKILNTLTFLDISSEVFRKNLKKKPSNIQEGYALLKNEYKNFKWFWNLPDNIRNNKTEHGVEELLKAREEMIKNKRDEK